MINGKKAKKKRSNYISYLKEQNICYQTYKGVKRAAILLTLSITSDDNASKMEDSLLNISLKKVVINQYISKISALLTKRQPSSEPITTFR